ncbi:ABC transporter ATP-binding protein [Clostridium thermarum]|uniref:ABC transporter ATP-binding protein n=1 Tax=Clostridium thermarum TaxID=1716543 RepID=UPI001122B2E2|nr:ABC transporter ATP-binding protein [Clostridium thermarum]
MRKNAISIKNYSFRYPNTETWVLDNLNFTLDYGEFILLSGFSGEGKSTLLNSINGIIPNIVPGEQKGEILVNGENIVGKKASDISVNIGSVLQNPDSQIINSKVEDEIAFGCENLNMEVEEIAKAIELSCRYMNLDKNWYTRNLSGGQKQRLMTAAILAMQQKILIFDEPLANLDLEGAHIFLRILKDFKEQGYGIVIIEHRLDIVIPYVDKVAWMNDGKVLFYKDKSEALEKARKEIVFNIPKKFEYTEPCFDAKQLNYHIAGRHILKNMNFTIQKGERIVIVGENGCGKTTLLRLLSKIIQPTSGELNQYIEKELKKWKKISNTWFKKLGYVYQNPSYQLFMPSVIDEINLCSKSERISLELLEQFRLANLKDRHPQSLSEGQKRRLTVACILAMEPEVILLDEPTVGQDYEGLKNMIEILNTHHEKNKNTMITITHDFRCAKALADRIMWMKHGELVKMGGPELVQEYFQANLEQELIGVI